MALACKQPLGVSLLQRPRPFDVLERHHAVRPARQRMRRQRTGPKHIDDDGHTARCGSTGDKIGAVDLHQLDRPSPTSACPVPDAAGIDVNEIAAAVIADVTTPCGEREVTQRRRRHAPQTYVDGTTLHVQAMSRHTPTGRV